MALFGKKENTEKKAPAKKAVKKAAAKKTAPESGFPNPKGELERMLKEPRITEKATLGIANSVYVFSVPQDATKPQVKKAVQAVYKVTPLKINIVNRKPRAILTRMRGGRGMKKGLKKAYVFLAKDDRIELI